MQMRWWFVALIVLAGCSERNDIAAPDGSGPVDEVLPPMAAGMELPGAPGDDALGAVVSLAPTPVPDEDTEGTFLRTRLRAVLAPGTTVGAVNEALAGSGAAIVSMTRGVPLVVLVIDRVEDVAEAEVRARELAETPAFLAVFPGRSFSATSSPGPSPRGGASHGSRLRSAGASDLPEGAGGDPVEHLVQMKMPASWNARLLDQAAVTVLVADHFPGRTENPRIDPLSFSFYGGFGTDAYGRNGNNLGNDGPFSAGVIGGNWDTDLPGIHPGPGLRIVGIPVGGLDMWEVSSAVYDELTLGGDRFVLLTGLTYAEMEGDLTPLEKATMALNWRLLVRNQTRDFESRLLHVVPGGDRTPFDDETPIGTDTSYWSVSARYSDLRTYLASLDPLETETEDFELLLNGTSASAGTPLQNVIIVGASNANGEPLATSAQLTDVRVHGEFVWGPCELSEETAPGVPCDGESAAYTGTFAAAPQVAGLGAYLWSLAPARTSLELGQLIRNAHSDGLVNGYRAVLGLDPNLTDPRVRETLLDPDDDGRFDETDVRAFLGAFSTFTEARESGNDDPDHSRWDLNGDGFTGGSTRTPFDLDANGQFGTVAVDGLSTSFDETALTDLDILCYYAHSDLYFGDAEDLEEILADCLEQLEIEIWDWEEELSSTGQLLGIAVYSRSEGTPVEGASVTFAVSGGTAQPTTATADSEGYAETMITPSPGSDRVEVTITAVDADDNRATSTVSAANLDNLAIRITQHYGRAWLVARSTDPDNVDYSLYTQSPTDRVVSNWTAGWTRSSEGDHNGTTCGVTTSVQASSILDFSSGLFSGVSASGRIEASGTQSTGDPGNSAFCSGQGQIQLTYRFIINEGNWRFRIEGNMGVEQAGGTTWEARVRYIDLQGVRHETPDVTDLAGEFVLGPGEYSLFLNPNGSGNTDVLGSAGFEGSCAFDLEMSIERVE